MTNSFIISPIGGQNWTFTRHGFACKKGYTATVFLPLIITVCSLIYMSNFLPIKCVNLTTRCHPTSCTSIGIGFSRSSSISLARAGFIMIGGRGVLGVARDPDRLSTRLRWSARLLSSIITSSPCSPERPSWKVLSLTVLHPWNLVYFTSKAASKCLYSKMKQLFSVI